MITQPEQLGKKNTAYSTGQVYIYVVSIFGHIVAAPYSEELC